MGLPQQAWSISQLGYLSLVVTIYYLFNLKKRSHWLRSFRNVYVRLGIIGRDGEVVAVLDSIPVLERITVSTRATEATMTIKVTLFTRAIEAFRSGPCCHAVELSPLAGCPLHGADHHGR